MNCDAGPGGYRVQVIDGPSLWVAPDGTAVCRVDDAPVPDELLVEFLLGPGLLLALALQDVFCLHASAVMRDGVCVAFLGPSGAGKSTLAALLDGVDGWRRVADDILPVTIVAGQIVALPHFPQLKLASDQQAAIAARTPDCLPLMAVCCVDAPGPTSATCSATATPKSPSAALLALLGETVSARLFAPDLAVRQLAFCAEIAAGVRVRQLHHPRRWDVAPSVAQALDGVLDGAVSGGNTTSRRDFRSSHLRASRL